MEDKAKLSPLNDELKNWVVEQLKLLFEYFESLIPPHPNELTADSLDDLWIAWKNTNVADTKATDSFLNCFGVGFGHLLVNELGFEWTYLEDEYGSDIAVRALPGTADARIAPLHFVLKRWESNEGRYISEAIREIDKMVDEYAQEHNVCR